MKLKVEGICYRAITISDILITVCPPIHDAMENGEIELGWLDTTAWNSKSHSDGEQMITDQTMFDCIWLVRYPDFGRKWNIEVFMNVTAAKLEDGIYREGIIIIINTL